jgi:Spy/CpxP family protein refolding chaperone
MEIVEQYNERLPGRRARGGGGERVDIRGAFRFASRLDLDRDQEQALRELQENHRGLTREARRDADAMAQINEDTLADIRGVLTADQQAEFDKWLAKQQGEKRGRGQRPERGRRSGGRRAPAEAPEEDTP